MLHLFRSLKWIALAAFIAGCCYGQASGPARSVVQGPNLPATCAVSQVFFKNTATVGLYECTAANTWTFVGGTGGSCSTLAGDVTGTCAANTLNSSGVVIPNASTATTQATGDASAQLTTDAFLSNALQSINPAVSVQAGTTGVLSNTPTYNNGTAGVGATLTAGSNGALTIDSYVVLLNDRVLIKNQAATLQNGVYTQTTLGDSMTPYVLTRATDYNTTTNINYTGTIPVLQGSTNANTGWNLNTQITAVGTSALTYTQASAGSSGGPPGGNVKASGNLANLNVIEGAGGKTIVDTGVAFTALARLASPTFTGNPAAPSQTACDNSTKLATTAYVSVACNTVKTSGSPFAATAQSQTIWNDTAGAYVVDLPATASGLQLCVGNYKTRTGAVSFVPPSGSTIYYKGVAGTTSSSTGIVSAGAAGDFICLEAVDSTTWEAIGTGQGTFTNN